MNVMKNETKTNASSQVYLKIKISMITSTADTRNKTTVFAVCFLCNRILFIPKQKLKIGQIIKTKKPTALLIPKANIYNISNMIQPFKHPNCFKCGNPSFTVTTQINGIRAFVKKQPLSLTAVFQFAVFKASFHTHSSGSLFTAGAQTRAISYRVCSLRKRTFCAQKKFTAGKPKNI